MDLRKPFLRDIKRSGFRFNFESSLCSLTRMTSFYVSTYVSFHFRPEKRLGDPVLALALSAVVETVKVLKDA